MTADHSEKKMLSRDESVDFLRGLLIALMVFGHTPPLGEQAGRLAGAIEWIYTFHMPIFLILSGYYFFGRLSDGAIIQPVLRRLVVPYLVFEAIYLLALSAVQLTGIHTSNTPPDTPVGFLLAEFLHPIGAFWFIHALILIQLSFAAGLAVTSRLRLTEQARQLGTHAVALALMALAVQLGLLKEWAAIYLVVGLVLRATGAGIALPAMIAVPLILVIGALCWGHPPQTSLLQLVWNLAIMGFFLAVAKSRLVAPSPPAKGMALLGKNTLSILIFHPFFIVGLRPASHLFLALDASGVLYSLATTLVALAGCLLVARAIDLCRLAPALFGQATLYRRH